MFPVIKRLIQEKQIPKWFVIYNYFTFLPLIVYPLFLFGSIFMFDNPDSVNLMMLRLIPILLYPLYLWLIFRYNFNLFAKIRIVAVLVPFLTVTAFFTSLVIVFGGG